MGSNATMAALRRADFTDKDRQKLFSNSKSFTFGKRKLANSKQFRVFVSIEVGKKGFCRY